MPMMIEYNMKEWWENESSEKAEWAFGRNCGQTFHEALMEPPKKLTHKNIHSKIMQWSVLIAHPLKAASWELYFVLTLKSN